MKYKAGDEVLIKAEITDISDCEERPYFVAPDCRSVHWVSEDKIIPMDKTYADGLKDAWDLAKKIVMGEEDGGFDSQEVIDVFGKSRYYSFKDLTAEEALAKIEAYEKEKEIKVGDVVTTLRKGDTGVIVRLIADDRVNILYDTGYVEVCYRKADCSKTGKHIDIESLLRQIGE